MILEVLLDLGRDQPLGQRNVEGLQQLVVDGFTCLLAALHEAGAFQSPAQVSLEFVEGVELAGHHGQLVVDLGHHALANGSDRGRDLDRHAFVLAELRGELEDSRLTGGSSDDGLVQSGHDAVFADLVGHRLLGEVLDVLAVGGGGQVQQQHVALGRRTLDLGVRPEPLRQQRDLLIDVGVGDLERCHLDRQPLVLRQLELGTDVDLGHESDLLAVLDLGHLDLRLPERHDVGLGQRLVVRRGHGRVDDLFEHRTAAEPLIDDLPRHLALAESGDLHLSGDPLVGGIDLVAQLVERQLHRHLDAGVRQLLDVVLHGTPHGRVATLLRR